LRIWGYSFIQLSQAAGQLRRNLGTIDSLLKLDSHGSLSDRQQREPATIRTLFEQQEKMFRTSTHQINDRIVSISQPHVRPIVRGKARGETEFGAKVAISMVDGYTFSDHLSFERERPPDPGGARLQRTLRLLPGSGPG